MLFDGFDGLRNNGGFLDFTCRGKSVLDGGGSGDGHGGGGSDGSGGGVVERGTVVASMMVGVSSSMSIVDSSHSGKSAIDNSRVGNSQDSGKNELKSKILNIQTEFFQKLFVTYKFVHGE